MDKLNIFNRDHFMVDLETMSTRQHACIIQVGVCKFTFEGGIKDGFLMNVDIQSCKDVGMHFSKDTYNWWMEQSGDVLKSCLKDTHPIQDVLTQLNTFIGKKRTTMVWAQGIVFDMGILSSAYTLCEIEKNWKYYQEMDNRTVFNLLNINNSVQRAKDTNHHNALADAVAQATMLIEVFKGD